MIRATTAPGERGRRLGKILDALESFYGEQSPHWPTDPYLFLIWWQCGYPPSEERCNLGWESLKAAVGVRPAELLAARAATLARALKAGGMVPEIRAGRVQSIARSVRDEFGGLSSTTLARLPIPAARRLLRTFPGIGIPGVDRILLFATLAPVAAVPSNCPHVVTRIESGAVPARYTTAYSKAQQALAALPADYAARRRAYLLLKRHGQELCKLKSPRCGDCPLAGRCAFALRRARRRRPGAARS
jgi:endonuclease III